MKNEDRNNPRVRGQVAEMIRTSCNYGNLLVPFGKDLEDMIDWFFDNPTTSREFGDKLQGYHNENRNNIALFANMNSASEKRKAILEQKEKLDAWDADVSAKKRAEEELKEPVEPPKADPNASPFGNPFGN